MSVNSRAETPATSPASGMLTESGVRFLATYRIWIICAVWLAVRGYVFWELTPNFYVEGFYKIAGDILDGFAPYSAFPVEYPPGALMLFALPRLLGDNPVVFGYLFAGLMLLADLGILFILWRIPALLGDSAGEIRTDSERICRSAQLCLTYILFTAVFNRLLFQGYDIVIALLLTACLYFSLQRKQVLVDLLLAIGMWFSLSVIVWVPLVWWHGFVSRAKSTSSEVYFDSGAFLRHMRLRAAVFISSLVLLYLPFFFYSGSSLFQIVGFHLERGTQLESTAASLLIAGSNLFGFELATDFTHRAIHLSGEIGALSAIVCGIVSVIAFLILTGFAARRLWVQPSAAARDMWLIRGLLALILGLLATSKVCLPQYLLWVSPLAAMLANDTGPRLKRIGWQLFAVFLISTVNFFFFYPNLIELHGLPGILVLGRNILLLYLMVNLLLTSEATQNRRLVWGVSPHTRKYLLYASILLLFVWGTMAAFRPIRNADIWMHLRVGADILASGEIPRIDHYSAVAAGRPHLTHEWLSALVFLGIYKIGGGHAFSVFRASMMLAMMLLLWFSLDQRTRQSSLVIPVMGLTAYIILERVFVRPHIFTLLFVCIWVYCLEHWRRDRRTRYLLILVPLQVLWANLHGGYIIAVVLGAMMTGTTALLAWRPSWSTNETYTRSDAVKLAVLTVACLAASLINPHGVQVLDFSLTVSTGSDYIKQFVYEWGSPLAAKYRNRAYGFDVAFGIFTLMWLGLALNWKRRPIIDAVQALVATALTVQAIRFVSFIGILGFPITVRAWQAVADTYFREQALKLRSYIPAALFLLLVASTLIYGFPYDKTNHRRIGWGFGGRLPYKTVAFLKKQQHEGIIFNDYTDGAYILHHLAPGIRPVMDSRIDVYGSELSEEYFASRKDPIKFFGYLNKYDVSFILLMQTKENIPVINLLSQIPASNLLLRADDRFLFSYDPERLPPEIRQRLEP